jgi:hypothetical protein
LLTCYSTPERLPGGFEEELALRIIAEKLRLRKINVARDMALKFKKVDETTSSLGSDIVSIIDLTPGSQTKTDEPLHADNNLKDLRGEALDNKAKSPKSVSGVSDSDTLVQGLEKEKEQEVKVDNMMKNDKTCPPSPAHPKTEITQGNLNEKKPPTGSNNAVADDEKVELLSPTQYKSKFGMLPSWLKDLFGPREKFLNDSESQTLEAYIVHDHGIRQALFKLPFGHQRLQLGLKQVMKKNKGFSWDKFMSLDVQDYRDLDQAVVRAKKVDTRERTVLAVDIHKKQPGLEKERMLVFFSLGAAVEPVHVKDCVGRLFDFPFEQCRTWRVSS